MGRKNRSSKGKGKGKEKGKGKGNGNGNGKGRGNDENERPQVACQREAAMGLSTVEVDDDVLEAVEEAVDDLVREGKIEEAKTRCREVISAATGDSRSSSHDSEVHPHISNMLRRLCLMLLDERKPIAEVVDTVCDTFGCKDPQRIRSVVDGIFSVLVQNDRLEELESLLGETLSRLQHDPANRMQSAVGDIQAKLGMVLMRREKLEEAEKHLKEGVDVLQANEHPLAPSYLSDFVTCLFRQSKFVYLIEALRALPEYFVQACSLDPEAHGEILGSLGMAYLECQGVAEAEKPLRDALPSLKRAKGKNHPAVAQVLLALSSSVEAQDRPADAYKEASAALETFRSGHDGDDPFMARCLKVMTYALFHMGKYAKAKAMHREAYALLVKLKHKGNDGEVGKILGDLAPLLGALNRHEEGEKVFVEALDLVRKAYGDSSPRVAAVLSSFGDFLRNRGKYQESESKLREALVIQRKTLGNQHHLLVRTFQDLSRVLRAQGKYEEATQMSRTELSIRKRQLGENHREVVQSMNSLGECLRWQKAYEEAEKLHNEAFAIVQKYYLRDLPPFLLENTLIDLGTVYIAQGKLADAEKMLRRAYASKTSSSERTCSDLPVVLGNLGDALVLQGKFDEAEKMARKGITAFKKMHGDHHPALASVKHTLGRALLGKEKPEQAEKMFREALSLQKETHEAGHFVVLRHYEMLSCALRQQGRIEEADEMA